MELTEEQKQSIIQWAAEGSGLSDIQKRMASELGIAMTYMDVRFLVLDLKIDIEDQTSTAPTSLNADVGLGQSAGPTAATDAPADGSLMGGVSVEVDRIMKPGSMVSGTVTFSDGVSAAWMLDQLGRLALEASTPGYSPSEEDLRAFQDGLRSALEQRGF